MEWNPVTENVAPRRPRDVELLVWRELAPEGKN
jgi:hypothetical protein